VAACRYVDEALPNAPLVLAAGWLERHRIDLVVYGDDFSEETLAK
jgi:glycerol-3-phosphate cytidylyltransferase-like family protein